MEVILHIGTHKTGTSSIQNFCSLNARYLRDNGVHYALDPDLSGRNANFLGASLATGRREEVRTFFDRAVAEATRVGLGRLLVSAETLYAMHAFFPTFGAASAGDDYWHNEAAAVAALARILAGHKVSVVCYFRRQDLFLDSLYNQMVKQPSGFAGDVESFLAHCSPMLDYHGHLRIWADRFGDAAVKPRVFDGKGNIVADFLSTALDLSEPQRSGVNVRVNDRLSRDVLEFKRELNQRRMGPVMELFAYRGVLAVEQAVGRPGPDVLSEARAVELVARHRDGNRAWSKRWTGVDADPFPMPTANAPDPAIAEYTGPTPARRRELVRAYRAFLWRPTTMAEMLGRVLLRAIDRRFPRAQPLVQRLRRATYRRAVEREARVES